MRAHAVSPLLLYVAFSSTPATAAEYAWPTTYGAYVSAYFDNGGTTDWQCGGRSYSGHKGTDIAGEPRNTPVYAGSAGAVIRRYDGFSDGYWGNWDGGGFGNHVALYHSDGHTTIYGHLNAWSGLPDLYEEIECLDAIGGIGTSGNSTGLHLHFEVRVGTDGVYYYSGSADDPFTGACSGPVSHWVDQNVGTPTQTCGDGTIIPPDFCDGKMNGLWCDGDDLVDCLAGDVSTREPCDHGCASMPLGVPDQCNAGPAEFCDGLMDGLWCDGDDLVLCDDDLTASSETCADGCQSMPLGVPDQCAEDTTCVGLMNGLWCDGDDLVDCLNDDVVSRQTCDAGCTAMPLGVPDECAPVPGDDACLIEGVGDSPTAPESACNFMDWEMSPDGYYLISRFGTDTDPTTWGHTSTCGYLQGHYDTFGCRYDYQTGACVDYDDQIPWVQGHVDWISQDMFDANAAYYPGNVPHPEYFYVAGAQRFGCGATLRVSNPETGDCVVVYAEDGGPGQTYEGPGYGGRRILDASPAVSDYLQIDQWGWLNADTVYVEWGLPGDVPGEACGTCESTPADDASAGSLTPWDPNHMQFGVDCR